MLRSFYYIIFYSYILCLHIYRKKDSYVTACYLLLWRVNVYIQCMYFYMLVFIMLNMTCFFVEKSISQLCRNR